MKVSTDMISDECWMLFCTEYQTVTKMYIKFGHQNDELFLIQSLEVNTKKLNIRDERSGAV
jgi:hypothetical protein